MGGGGGWWWIPLHYLVTSENDFRLPEAVTTKFIPQLSAIFHFAFSERGIEVTKFQFLFTLKSNQ